MMGGRIWVESRPGAGSEFFFTATFGIGAEPRKRIQPHPDLIGLRVLAVDDNATARQIVRGMLEAMNFTVDVASSGADALRQLAAAGERPFGLVMLDWKMSGLDGFQTLEAIRADPLTYGRPKIVMITAYGREEVMKRVQAAHLDGFLIKPVTQSTMFDAIIAAFDKTVVSRQADRVNAIDAIEVADLRGARILLVEDNEINQQVAREILEQAGLVVVLANDGREAVDAITRVKYDAVLMDIQMPLMDGHEATRRIRAWEAAQAADATPIIAMTAHAMAGDIEKSLAAGMNAHVTKPIDLRQLFSALRQWITPRAGHEAGPAPAARVSADVEPLPASLPGIDIAEGLARLGGNARVYRDVLGRFTRNFADAGEQAARLLAAGDADAAGRIVHSLKGVAGNLGAARLHDAAAAAEAALRHGAPADRSATLQALRVPLQEVVAGLAQLDPAALVPGAPDEPVTRERVAGLPPELRDEFRTAVTRADLQHMLALVDRVAVLDPRLARGLRALVDEFAYDRLLAVMSGSSAR